MRPAEPSMQSPTRSVRSLAEYAERGHIGRRSDLRQIPVTFGNSGYVIQYRVSASLVVIARIKHTLKRP
jgi:plasmid stabilization system protein ParE